MFSLNYNSVISTYIQHFYQTAQVCTVYKINTNHAYPKKTELFFFEMRSVTFTG